MFKKLLTYSILSLVGMMGFLGVFIENNNIGAGDSHYIVSIGEESFALECGDDGFVGPCLPKDDKNAEMQKMLNSLVGGLNIILDILTIIVSPAIMLASWLMSPDWTSGDLFGIRPALHSLWVTVSNVVYFVYAILLIFIALATIFNSQNYGYKQLLPKLALGVILVPLTWWFVQFTISLSTYITASVISIPMETLTKYSQPGSFWETPSIPKKIVYKNSKAYTDDGKAVDKDTVLCEKDKGKCISPKAFLQTGGGMYSPLLVYTFSVFKFQNVKFLNNNTDTVKAILDIIHQGIIGAIMFIVYGLLVVALIFMLLMRAVKLWFYAIFSPLFTIKYVLGDKGFGDADKDGSFKITEFIGLAFVPAVVSLALSFGLIIISVMHSPMSSGGSNPNSSCTTDADPICTLRIMGTSNTIVSKTDVTGIDKKSVTTVTIGGDKDENKISYDFEGSVSGGSTILSGVTSAIGSTGNLFGTIILDIIALIFIWIAFMAGKGVSKAASAAVKPFQDIGEKIGGMAKSLPKYAPLPLPGGSVAGMSRTVDLGKQAFDSKMQQKEDENIGKFAPQLVQGMILEKNRAEAEGKLKNATTHDEMRKILGDLVSNAKDVKLNTEKEYQTISQFGKLDTLKRTVMEDRTVTSDEKLHIAMKKFFDNKLGDMTDLEHKAINDYWRKSASAGANGATGSKYTVQQVLATDGKSNSLSIDIEGVTVSIKADGTGLSLTDEQKKKLTEKITKKTTKSEFDSKLSGVNQTVRDAIIKAASLEFNEEKAKK